MAAQYDVISAWIARWKEHFVELVVFGTTDPQQIACLIDAFCQRELAAAVADYLFYESSQGAVCGMRLVDGRRVVLKVHQPSCSLGFLQAIVLVQHYLRAQSYPCPKPLLAPQPLAFGTATVEELVDEGVYHHAHNPAIRRSLAEMLAWLIKLTWTPETIPGLRPAALDIRLPPGVLWPVPHSKLFDFEATAAGAEEIDEIARNAQEIVLHGAGQLVLGHTDWSVKHLRYVGERVSVIYDWDSLALEKEPVIVGHASVNFTYTEFLEEPGFMPDEEPGLTPDEEAWAFIADYEVARGKPFTADEWQTLKAAQTYGSAYGARCQHALKGRK